MPFYRNLPRVTVSATKAAIGRQRRARIGFGSMAEKEPRRFQPLDPSKGDKGGGRVGEELMGIVFDVDGTLCEPQNYMFAEMRSALGIPKSTDILDHIYALPETEQGAAHGKIRSIERTAMAKQKAQPGLVELMTYLESRQIQKAICTRNFDAPVEHLLTTFLPTQRFYPIITREFRPPKPDPAGILHIAKSWDLSDGGSRLIMVGDSLDDMTAGFRAGAATVLLVNPENARLATHEHTDLRVKRLDELIDVLENGFQGQIKANERKPDTKAQAQESISS